MPYQLGVDLGTTFTCAAVHEGSEARIIELSGRGATIPSVVFLDESGTMLVGEAAERRAVLEPTRSASEFKRRFGDTTPIFVGGSPYSADALTAELLKSVYAQVVERQGGPPTAIAITHPANWGSYKLELLDQVVRRANLEGAVMLSEPEAAVLNYAQLERVPDGSVVAVFDLGGGTFDASVIRKTSSGVETLGQPEGLERLGGIDLDETVFNFVVQHLDGALDDIDMDNEVTLSALSRLRADCVDAKIALSSDESVSIPVMLPGAQTTIRMTRGEFESLARPSLTSAVDALRRALGSAGVEPDELTAVLMAGGSSRIPLISEMVGSELGRPVAVDAHPKHIVAMGAAVAAAQSVGSGGAAAITDGAASAVAASAVVSTPDSPEPVAPTPPPAPTQAPPPVAAPPPAQPAPVVAPVPQPAPVAAPVPRPAPAAAELAVGGDGSGQSKSRTGLWIGIAAGVIVAAIGAGVALSGGGDDVTTSTPTTLDSTQTTVADAGTTVPGTPSAPSAPTTSSATTAVGTATSAAATQTTAAPATAAPAATAAPTTAVSEPFGPGDDPQLDLLTETCLDGNLTSCDELYFASAVNSDYEVIANSCGDFLQHLAEGECVGAGGVQFEGFVGAGEAVRFSFEAFNGQVIEIESGQGSVTYDLWDAAGNYLFSGPNVQFHTVTVGGVYLVDVYNNDGSGSSFFLFLSVG